MKRATKADMPRVVAFLERHIATSMFPLSNYAKHGLEGPHPHASTFWFAENDGIITDVLTRSNNGSVFPQVHTFDRAEIAKALRGLDVTGILGAADQVVSLQNALGFTGKTKLDAVEPHFALNLNDMQLPDLGDYTLIPLQDADRDLMIDWRTAYEIEALNETEEAGRKIAANDVKNYTKNDSHRVLVHNEQPVSTTGFNATLPSCVQIGGVYTPPELRGRGYARAAVAMHLQEAKRNGVTDSVLFASSEAAATAYISIGFRHIGAFTILIYDQPQVFHA